MDVSDGRLNTVILAGGSGTRFWPLSREQLPKQLLSIVDVRSMLALTLERALLLVPEESVWVVTTRSQAVQIRRELANLERPRVRVIISYPTSAPMAISSSPGRSARPPSRAPVSLPVTIRASASAGSPNLNRGTQNSPKGDRFSSCLPDRTAEIPASMFWRAAWTQSVITI